MKPNPTSDQDRAQFAANLRTALEASPTLDAAKLGRAVGVTKASMSRYLSGQRLPTVLVAMRIASALGLSVEQLVAGKVRRPGGKRRPAAAE